MHATPPNVISTHVLRLTNPAMHGRYTRCWAHGGRRGQCLPQQTGAEGAGDETVGETEQCYCQNRSMSTCAQSCNSCARACNMWAFQMYRFHDGSGMLAAVGALLKRHGEVGDRKEAVATEGPETAEWTRALQPHKAVHHTSCRWSGCEIATGSVLCSLVRMQMLAA